MGRDFSPLEQSVFQSRMSAERLSAIIYFHRSPTSGRDGAAWGAALRRECVTFDEVVHIGAGVSCLQKLDLPMTKVRTPGTREGSMVFETAAIDHSGTSR
jgi:hypothetical protein